jgi:hypothetical protein
VVGKKKRITKAVNATATRRFLLALFAECNSKLTFLGEYFMSEENKKKPSVFFCAINGHSLQGT